MNPEIGQSLRFGGHRPGALAGVVGLHMDYYAPNWKFGLDFETKVAAEMAEFLGRADPQRDLFLTCWQDDQLVGSITIDASGGGEMGAHLRWFIVSDEARGTGLGRELMDRAMTFCRESDLRNIWLTTFSGLDAARKLYEANGFSLVGESDADQWNGGVREQLFAVTLI